MHRTIGLVLVGAAACGSGANTPATLSFPETALVVLPGSDGHVQVTVRSSPQPPSIGLTNFEFTVTDPTGAPIDGVQLSVLPWMPAMGHGAPVSPVVTSTGPGTFQITNVDLFMPGEWQLRSSLSGSVTDSVAPEFQIQ